jgi:hypothetical protein
VFLVGTFGAVRYDGKGTQVWMQSMAPGYDANVAAPDGAGGVFIGGHGQQDGWLARYDASGSQLWLIENDLQALGAYPAGAARDGSGGVFVGHDGSTGRGLSRISSSGALLWSGINVGFDITSVAYDGSSGFYVSTSGGWGKPIHSLDRYDSMGNILWHMTDPGNQASSFLVQDADGSGGVFVVGSTYRSTGGPHAGGSDAWIARYDAGGVQLWIRQLGSSLDDWGLTATADGAGGVYLAGATEGELGGANAGGYDVWLARYDSAGNQLWIQQFGSSGDDGASIPGWYGLESATDGSGGLYLGGATTGDLGGPNVGLSDAWLARYDSTCPTPEPYCVASSTSIPGCQATIAGLGTPSYANPTGFTISSGAVPGSNIGICFFGNHGRASNPFGTLGGQICVQGPVFRAAPKLSGGTKGNCDGVFNFTLQDLINKSPIVFAGAILNAQIWARDPANPDGFLLSDGLEFTVCP